MKDFEYRPGQVVMAEAALAAIRDGARLLVEAGTGVGKTLAYLAPAVASGRKVVISTGTKNLQEQIIEKDIPIVQALFPGGFKSACMKGRGNYLCRRRFRRFAQQPLFAGAGEGRLFTRIQAWADETYTGDRAELADLPDDYAAWGEINSKSELCLGSACAFYESCFITRMRAEAAVADIVVVNHHLFFADLNLRENAYGEVIPRYDAVVFDEAHLVEDTATAYFGVTLSNYRITDAARDAQRELRAAKIDDKDAARLIENLHARSARFFDSVRAAGGGKRRLKKPDATQWAGAADEFRNAIGLAADYLGSLAKATEPVRALAMRFADIGEQVAELTAIDKDENVYWVEARGRGVFMHSSPIDVSVHLRQKLYPRAGAAVFTSATLSTGGDFSFIRSRLGLENPEELVIESPFDYRSQAVLYLPGDLPEPASERFAESAAERIGRLLALSRGRAFVLFTSRRNLDRCWDLLDGRFPFTTFRQGDGPRSVILEKFREDTSSILFATMSFWQGVDVKGESLSAVIVDKLPFATPDDPLVAARVEYIEKRGGSGFREYQLPRAALTLRQGLGRLIRSKTDHGLLAVLDRRMKTKSYGKTFLRALPGLDTVDDLDALERRLGAWWGAGEQTAAAPGTKT